MYGRGGGMASAIVTGTGVVMLPNTSGNTLGSILAYTATTIGGLALTSQLIVRILRRKYSA